MKQVYFSMLFLLVGFCLNAQCPTGDLRFSRQSQIDSFLIDYPNCTELSGQVIIDGDVENLNGLSNIISIAGGNLEIRSNSNLKNLEGLENLISLTKSIIILNNTGLMSLKGLDNLQSVGDQFFGGVSIWNNPVLTNIEGLKNLTSTHGVSIIENPVLKNLKGLEGLTNTAEDIHIGENAALTSLEGLENYVSCGGRLKITENPLLLSMEGLESLTSVGKNVEITRNNALTSLDGLENLTSVGRDLSISENPMLSSLEGLEKLESVATNFVIGNHLLTSLRGLENLQFAGSLVIYGNLSLTNLQGLEKLEIIVGVLSIQENSALTSLRGVNNLKSIGSLRIYRNLSITNLQGLESIEIIEGAIVIEENPALISLRGLENLQSIGSSANREAISIIENPILTLCSIKSICKFLLQNPILRIEGNATGCSSKEEILNSCEIGAINYTIFYDQNQNGIQDSNELIVPNISIEIEQTDETLISGSTDRGNWVLEYGNYTASFIDNPNWELTTPFEQNFEISADTPFPNIFFGIFPKTIFSKKITSIQGGWLRCGENVPFDIITKNLGTTLESGTIWFEIDPRLTDFTSNADIVNGNTLGWNFQDLHPGHGITESVNIQIPVPPDIPVGEILKFKSYFDNGENEFEYNVEMRCAYDPNDKLVTPDLSTEYQGTAYTKFDEDLFYTVRFQNTGNDVAYDVVIRDTLDANLDPSTFKIISSSHYEVLNVSMEDERNLTFEFKDIFLPDSTTNFDASNGYVSYLIKTKDGLPEETPIQNTASIYFDFNPPIVTNTTENVMVTELPTSSSVDKNQQLDIHLFPNPTDGKIYLSGVDLKGAVVSVYDLTGRLVLVEQSGMNEIILPETTSGMLLLKIETEEGIAVKRVFKNY